MKTLSTFRYVASLFVCITSLRCAIASAESESNGNTQHIRKLCLNRSYRNSRTSLCDPDSDGLTNKQETKLKTNRFRKDTDKDGLTDGQEVKKYHTNPRKADTDGDGYKDGEEVSAGTNPRDPNSHPSGHTSCTIPTNPFDINSNTTAFGIPAGLTGNINRGNTLFANTCFGCHGADKGTNDTYAQLVAAVTGPKMGFSFPQQTFADLVAYLNRTNIPTIPDPNCVLTPTPIPTNNPGGGSSQPTPTPTPTPTSIPGASCTPQPNPFDGSGNTTSFSIPAGISGNITTGHTQFTQTCSGCHGTGTPPKGTNLNYPSLFAAVNGAPMFLTSLSQQQIANLVAYLNQTNIPPTPGPNCNPNDPPTPTPTPTATPGPVERGHMVYQSACSSCHGNTPNGDLRHASKNKIQNAIREVSQMRSLSTLSSNQLNDLVTYLAGF